MKSKRFVLPSIKRQPIARVHRAHGQIQQRLAQLGQGPPTYIQVRLLEIFEERKSSTEWLKLSEIFLHQCTLRATAFASAIAQITHCTALDPLYSATPARTYEIRWHRVRLLPTSLPSALQVHQKLFYSLVEEVVEQLHAGLR